MEIYSMNPSPGPSFLLWMPPLYIYLFSRTQTRRDIKVICLWLQSTISIHSRAITSQWHLMPSIRLQQQRMKRHLQGKVPMLLISSLSPARLGIPLPVTFAEHLLHSFPPKRQASLELLSCCYSEHRVVRKQLYLLRNKKSPQSIK